MKLKIALPIAHCACGNAIYVNLNYASKRALALEAESGDRAALLAKNAELGTSISEELKKIFETGVGYTAQQRNAEKKKRRTD